MIMLNLFDGECVVGIVGYLFFGVEVCVCDVFDVEVVEGEVGVL